MHKTIGWGLICCLLWLSAEVYASHIPVRVGVYENPPKVQMSSDGKPSGIFGDLLQEMAQREHWNLIAVPCEWEQCLQMLEVGELDLMPDVADSPERRLRFSFGEQQVLHSWSQLFGHDDTQVETLLDLKGMRITVLEGSIQEQQLQAILTEFGVEAQWLRVSTLQQGLEQLAQGRSDFLATNTLFGHYFSQQYGLRATPIIFAPIRLHYAAPLEDSRFLPAVDHWLESWKADAASPYYRVLNHWRHPQGEGWMDPRWRWLAVTVSLLLLLLLMGGSALMRRVWRQLQFSRERLRESDLRLNTVLDNMDTYVYTKDMELRYRYVSSKVCELFQRTPDEVLGKTDEAFFDSRSVRQIESYDRQVLESGEKIIKEEISYLAGDDTTRTFLSVKLPLRRADGTIYGLCGIATDISDRQRHEQEVRQLTFYDLLTGLPNRRLLLDRLEHSLQNCVRHQQDGAVILFDLDNFRALNDTGGHPLGDQLLQQLAERLRERFRASDTLARFGSDEFVLLLESLEGERGLALQQVGHALDKLQSIFDQPFMLDTGPYQAGIRVGVALYSDGFDSATELLKRAELALFDAKRSGRGHDPVHFFDASLQFEAEQRSTLEQGLRQAVKNEELRLFYQPQYHLDGHLLGVEGLIRWQKDEHTLISPVAFIPVAEDSGLILEIGHWALLTACRQLVVWAETPSTAGLTISVNISAVQIYHRDFVEQVLEAITETGADPTRLQLELTESLLVDEVEETIAKMLRLKAAGIRFSLDDFGTGFSSLSILTRLPLDELKIDQQFVRDLNHDPKSAAVVRTIIDLGRNLGMEVIAEGVETRIQQQMLHAFGCDQYQGYLFCKPKPVHELNEQLHPAYKT